MNEINDTIAKLIDEGKQLTEVQAAIAKIIAEGKRKSEENAKNVGTTSPMSDDTPAKTTKKSRNRC